MSNSSPELMRNVGRFMSTVAAAETTSPRMPFQVPNTNFTRNSKRYVQAGNVLRRWLRELLEMRFPGISQAMVPLFSLSDNLDVTDQRELTMAFGGIKTWFIAWIATGSRDIGALKRNYWNRKRSCPNILVGFFSWFEGSGRDIAAIAPVVRFILSWLDLPKVYTIPSSPSLEPITGSFSGSDQILREYDLSEAISSLGLDPTEIGVYFGTACKNFTFHESSAAGPNGHALWASHLDALALQNDIDLYDIWRELADKMGLSKLSEMVASSVLAVMRLSFSEKTSEQPIHSRLHCIFEKGTKARIIAIGDYFTQALLSPFMATLRHALSFIPQDYTYNQEAGFAKVLEFTKAGRSCYSLDLSKATDRLPLALQVRIMGLLIKDAAIADLWGKVMTERDFMTENGHAVRYAVGQPQGVKSSFHSLAFTHHVIVRLAAIEAGVENFVDYVILGDDIVLTDVRVVKAYTRLMGILGVSIAMEKSLFHIEGQSSAAEFCKRIAFNGIEITGVPMHLLANVCSDPQFVFSLWEIMAARTIATGDALYDFFALFLGDLDYERLYFVNVLPKTVSGLKHVYPCDEMEAYSVRGFQKSFGFSLADVESFYYFVLISDQLSKIDGVIRKASSFLSIALETSKLGEFQGTGFEGSSIHLSVAVQDKLAKLDSEKKVMHPVQFAARSLGTKLVNVLNAFSTDVSLLPSMVKSGAINALAVSLDSQPQFTNTERTAMGNRRVLDKAIRLLEETVASKTTDMRVFVGKIGGVTQAWSVSVGIGKGLVITPHLSVNRAVLATPSSRRRNLLKGSPSVVRTRK